MFAPLKALKPIGKNPIELFCRYLINIFPDLAVFRNRLNLENIAQIAEMLFLLDTSLKLQQGTVLKKHHGKGAHHAIMQTVVDFTALSTVIQFAEMR